MTNVLIRDVPADDLAELRQAAAAEGSSLQSYLLSALHAHAVHQRRLAALERIGERLQGRSVVPAVERQAVLDAVSQAHAARAHDLADSPSDA